MEKKTAAENIRKNIELPGRSIAENGERFPLWLFQSDVLPEELESAERFGKSTVTNMLNRIHFLDGTVQIQLKHIEYDDTLFVRVFPEPCLGNEVICRWMDKDLSFFDLSKYLFRYLVIEDGLYMIFVPAALIEMNGDYLRIELPETSFAVGKRRARRYSCDKVKAELSQSGFLANGELLDFNSFGFRVRIKLQSFISSQIFNPGTLSIVKLSSGPKILFSGICECIRQNDGLKEMDIVLKPADQEICRFEKRLLRNPRQRLIPSPNLVFEHPFSGKRAHMEVQNISTSGFSVREKASDGILMQGMIIPDMTINFAGASSIKCSAQVIYRREEDQGEMRCGLAILDMSINDYSILTNILSNALDPNSYVSSKVDMESLWEFFFNSGFIYPNKYKIIQHHRRIFKETYERLYQGNPEIAKHFTYQRNGRIYGHIAMIRAYEKAWMIHHHAAMTMENRRVGLIVLKQIMHHLNDMHRLPSAEMDYVMSYYRPDKRFPDRAFGGFARSLKNPTGCSLDLFAYLPYTSLSVCAKLPEGWSLTECSAIQLWELNRVYNHYSGGLLLRAMNLDQKNAGTSSIEKVYERAGFFRKNDVYSLSRGKELNAVLIVDKSDLGFNLSELLNGIKIIVTNPVGLSWNVLSIAIAQLTALYDMERIPVLFYPIKYVHDEKIPHEKEYQAWVLNVRYGNEYMEYMQKKFKIGYK